jgi:hypothetical protein
VLEDEHSQNDLGRRTRPTAPGALGPPLLHAAKNLVHERFVFEQLVDAAQLGIHESFGRRDGKTEQQNLREGELSLTAARHRPVQITPRDPCPEECAFVALLDGRWIRFRALGRELRTAI